MYTVTDNFQNHIYVFVYCRITSADNSQLQKCRIRESAKVQKCWMQPWSMQPRSKSLYTPRLRYRTTNTFSFTLTLMHVRPACPNMVVQTSCARLTVFWIWAIYHQFSYKSLVNLFLKYLVSFSLKTKLVFLPLNTSTRVPWYSGS